MLPMTRRWLIAWKRRGDRAGQDQLRRVRHGLVERELRLPSGAQSARPHARSRRIVGRIGGGHCGGNRSRLAGLRHRRLDPPAGVVLRRGGADADLRARVALWADRVCLVARQDRAVRQDRERHGADAGGHGRPRSHGLDFCRGARARLLRLGRTDRSPA